MRKLIFVYVIVLLPYWAYSLPSAYKQQYGSSYTQAIIFCKQQSKKIQFIAQHYDCPSDELMAIVFPELIRYNQFKDFFETQALEVAYINGGTAWANFSIGHFQMKPSFLEELEIILGNADTEGWANDFQSICEYQSTQPTARRRERLQRLKNINWQLIYLSCFYQYANQRFRQQLVLEKSIWKPEDKICYLATLYNSGMDKTETAIKKWMYRPCFPYGPKYPTKGQQPYSTIAAHFQTEQTIFK